MPEPIEPNGGLAWIVSTDGLLQSGDWPLHLQPAINGPGVTKPKRASVLMPLFFRGGGWHLLFIRRVRRDSDRHSGQVAFPGGRRDDTDASAVATALREAHEEVGLSPASVTVLSPLERYYTVSDYVVTPVVGIVPWPYAYVAQPTEVARIFSIPLKFLMDEKNVVLRQRRYRSGDDPALAAQDIKVVYYREYDGELLWGATARMTVALLKMIYLQQIDLEALSQQYSNQ